MSGRIEEDATSKKLLQEYKETMRKNALEIILRTLPQKLVSLDKMLKSDPKLNRTCEEVDAVFRKDLAESRVKVEELRKQKKEEEEAAPAAKKRKHDADDNGEDKKKEKDEIEGSLMTMPSNKLILETTEILRAELLAMVNNVDTVKLWIQLNVPRIEDGNNFGVSVQEDMVSELSRAEDNAFALLESITKYYIARAKLVTRCFKFPKLPDFEMAVSEIDQKQYLNNVLSLVDLRNNYALLYDMIIKNIDKLENPRGSEHMSHLF